MRLFYYTENLKLPNAKLQRKSVNRRDEFNRRGDVQDLLSLEIEQLSLGGPGGIIVTTIGRGSMSLDIDRSQFP